MAQNNTVYPIEKIISVLSYFTCGFVGLLYLIIALLQKQGLRSFLRYHVFMSIFSSASHIKRTNSAFGQFLITSFFICFI